MSNPRRLRLSRRMQLTLESLESRTLLSATPLGTIPIIDAEYVETAEVLPADDGVVIEEGYIDPAVCEIAVGEVVEWTEEGEWVDPGYEATDFDPSIFWCFAPVEVGDDGSEVIYMLGEPYSEFGGEEYAGEEYVGEEVPIDAGVEGEMHIFMSFTPEMVQRGGDGEMVFEPVSADTSDVVEDVEITTTVVEDTTILPAVEDDAMAYTCDVVDAAVDPVITVTTADVGTDDVVVVAKEEEPSVIDEAKPLTETHVETPGEQTSGVTGYHGHEADATPAAPAKVEADDATPIV